LQEAERNLALSPGDSDKDGPSRKYPLEDELGEMDTRQLLITIARSGLDMHGAMRQLASTFNAALLSWKRVGFH